MNPFHHASQHRVFKNIVQAHRHTEHILDAGCQRDRLQGMPSKLEEIILRVYSLATKQFLPQLCGYFVYLIAAPPNPGLVILVIRRLIC